MYIQYIRTRLREAVGRLHVQATHGRQQLLLLLRRAELVDHARTHIVDRQHRLYEYMYVLCIYSMYEIYVCVKFVYVYIWA